MIDWFNDIDVLKSVFAYLAEYDSTVTTALSKIQSSRGYCSACKKPSTFRVTEGAEPAGEWRNLLEGMHCLCGTNGRTRLALDAWRSFRTVYNPTDSLIFERVTPLYALIKSEQESIQSCEYLGDEKTAGQYYEINSVSIRHENIMALSYADQSFDLMMHFDIVEHIPDHRQAFRECCRCLRPGGAMLFTLPFFPGLDRHLVRAEATVDGIQHHLEPAYHGNPLGGGALVFFHPGWQLLDDLAEAGFGTSVAFEYNPAVGIVSNGCPYPDGHMWPVVFLARRPPSSQ